MTEIIQNIFLDPPIVVARLGGSTTPLAAYSWGTAPNPRNDEDTAILPDWSLNVLPDGSIEPFRPDSIRFRDGILVRPVCPFIEVWAQLGEPDSEPTSWRDAPVTEALLAKFGVDLSAVAFTIDARNAKAARRTLNQDLIYGLFPSVRLRGDQHEPVSLSASSPPGVAKPMIPRERSIPFGSIQVIRPHANPTAGSAPWPATIDLEVLRVRFTPATGTFYGPPQASIPTPESSVPAVQAANAFLDPDAGWFNSRAAGGGFVIPGDTFDFFEVGGTQFSLGVVDDTCEVRIDVTLRLAQSGVGPLAAHTNIFVGPPDFAPDRRPFLSIADELNDRSATAEARSSSMSAEERAIWVQDLFERIYETASLLNVDYWRRRRGLRGLDGARLATTAIVGDGVVPVDQALGSRDALRNPNLSVPGITLDVPLPLSQHARERHRSLSDLQRLVDFVVSDPTRLKTLIRGPFEVEAGEGGNATTMRMPPFMRASNASPLTLAAWQYSLLMRWAGELTAPRPPAPVGDALVAALAPAAVSLSEAAATRRAEVLARLS
ncbi:hypothetical protein FJ420_06915 [Mesorhizobium sp. B3-1-3]|uniref:hypothetical protein n=1 Tax=unclassified Mesorhizobium TaxID=325217 RepID=UPI00112C12F9|nr:MULTISPECIES: hypothetical protein [unclassified Mesorhizobium]TPI62534.1 hypothetical protein FJ424_20390 [Mesorhizobium sp. B3-1-8]TPI74103.1 hypothetical protein FJ420_06915 [Mesorhizobium sp. B3-1-3]